ncbi:MAG: histidine kinase [Treponema sp.]|jgi:two-component system sensor histidine kinase YesM|nr:histidine kinase [Treponema sp.]
MRFKVKLFFTYSLLVAALIVLSGVIFGSFSYDYFERVADQEIHILAESISHQLDETVRPMIFITEFLLSDTKSLSAINTLGRVPQREGGPRYIGEAKRDLASNLLTYATEANFHRVTYFSALGDILSSNSQRDAIPDGSADLRRFDHLPLINAAGGKPVLLPPYADPWDPKDPQRVFGVARLVMGNEIPSYLEVQKPYRVLENFYTPDASGAIRAGIANSRGDVIFSQFDGHEEKILLAYLDEGADPPVSDRAASVQAEARQNAFSFRTGSDIVAVQYSAYTDTYTAVMRTGKSMSASFGYITRTITGLCLLVCLVSAGLIYALSLKVTAPISRLAAKMELTSLDNITRDIGLEGANDEFARLYQAYNRLLKRLSYSINQEKEMSLLHLQAQFDTLQTQVNPHFLYNVLNILSHRGVLSGDEVICGICEKLAAMMRYSAEISRRMVTIREELEYVAHYLYLLKTRYQQKLSYRIETEPGETERLVPKMVIQPLIENAINHGFKDGTQVMDIAIKSVIDAGRGRWYIEVKDNGSGFGAGTLAELEKKMRDIRLRVKNGNRNLEIDIGGMGLLNIYARFYMIFGDSAIFRITNLERGASIIIGAMEKKNGEEKECIS